jgi:hypothetical protein
MNPVWFMLMLAVPAIGSNFDGGEVMVDNHPYSSYMECVDNIDKALDKKKEEPEIGQVGVVCVQGFVKTLKKGNPT